MAHCARQGMRVAQETGRPLYLAHFHQAADVSGADGDPADFHLRYDVAAQAQGGAFFPQEFRRACVFVAEAVVVARHKMNGVPAAHQQLRDKILPAGGHHLPVKGGHDDVLDAVQPADQVPAVVRGVDERAGNPGDHLFGRAVEGENGGGAAPAGGLLRRPAEESGMAQVDPVKKPQGNDSFFHTTLQRNF